VAKAGIEVCSNLPRGLNYENPPFYTELENDFKIIKSIDQEIDIIVLTDFNSRRE
jgi:hypothetical protein